MEVTMSASWGQHLGGDGGVQQDALDLQNYMQNAFTGISCANNVISMYPVACCEMHLQQFHRRVSLLFFTLFSNQLCIRFGEVRHHCCGGNGKKQLTVVETHRQLN